MFERSFNGSKSLRVVSMLAIVAYLTIITQLFCLICSAQYRITNLQKKNEDLLSSWPIASHEDGVEQHDSELQNRPLPNKRAIDLCLNRPEGCTVLDHFRRLAASCSTVRLVPSSKRLLCVPFAKRQMQFQLPETFPNLALLGKNGVRQASTMPEYNAEEPEPAEESQLEAQRESDRLRKVKANYLLAHLDWLTPVESDADPSDRSFAGSLSAPRPVLSLPKVLDNDINYSVEKDKICSLGSIGKLSEEELANCLDRIESLFIANMLRSGAGMNSDRSMASLKPYGRYLFGSPKRSTDETHIMEWPMAKAFLKELRELDGKPETSLSNRTSLPAGEFAAAPTESSPTTITSTGNTNNVADEASIEPGSQIKPEADEEALECRLREYTFKAMNKDREGNHCSGYVTATICYGGCETGEISDWLFPHKKSIHKVCQHGQRVRRKAILADCNSLNAFKELSVYHYVDARSCKCEKCNKANTTCMGSLTAPKL